MPPKVPYPEEMAFDILMPPCIGLNTPARDLDSVDEAGYRNCLSL
ncbi:hypothetical protein [Mastigocoleus sp. MO_188.B34]|nr:hypothetical protein [Mastigocoleus sp. MO_188.B34]